jgi:hypothetical protein
MQRLALVSITLLLLSTPAVSADLDGPVYRGPPRVVERERIIERDRYYDDDRVYVERHAYVDDDYYEPRVYRYYDRPYGYGYGDWRPRYFFPRAHQWHRHHHHRHHRW